MSEELMTSMEDGNANVSTDSANLQQYLTFITDGLTLAVSTHYVIEIITNHRITLLPMVPGFVKGIINLRGQIIPIIDIRLKMGKAPAEPSDTNCIIVLTIDSVSVGILVDTVSQVLEIDTDAISSVPVNQSHELVNGMVSLSDQSIVLFLDCERLIEN